MALQPRRGSTEETIKMIIFILITATIILGWNADDYIWSDEMQKIKLETWHGAGSPPPEGADKVPSGYMSKIVRRTKMLFECKSKCKIPTKMSSKFRLVSSKWNGTASRGIWYKYCFTTTI